MFCWPFTKNKKNEQTQIQNNELRPLKVVVVGSDSNSALPAKETIFNILKQYILFSVVLEKEQTLENFLNLNNKNFFDFWDSGLKILKQHQADVLIRIYQEKNSIRLNFQTDQMYQTNEPPFFSLLESLYLPISYFTQNNLPPQISNLIAATLIALNLKKDFSYQAPLEKLINILSKNKIPEGIEQNFIPHLLVFLSLNYISAKSDHFGKKDVKLILNLTSFAYKNLKNEYDSLAEGALLTTLGQTYQCAALNPKADSFSLIERAIESYKKALKHFSRYIFPYDYGRLSLVLSALYFQFFQLSEDSQTLRDSVFYLREAEKIFTSAGFPELWAKIEHNLGTYLSLLSARSNNIEIAQLAIQNFKNEQYIFTKQTNPEKWADIEIQIANIYYYLGKKISNKRFLETAINHYSYAYEIFDLLKQNKRTIEIETYIQKADEEIMRLN